MPAVAQTTAKPVSPGESLFQAQCGFCHGRDATGGIATGLDDLPLFASQQPESPPADPLFDALAAIDPDALSPREALEALYALKRLAAEH